VSEASFWDGDSNDFVTEVKGFLDAVKLGSDDQFLSGSGGVRIRVTPTISKPANETVGSGGYTGRRSLASCIFLLCNFI